MDFDLGDVVYSTSGRDSGKYYVIFWVDGVYVGICDGDLHKVNKVKKKKNKHINSMKISSSFLNKKLRKGEKVTNAEVRRAISEFLEMDGGEKLIN